MTTATTPRAYRSGWCGTYRHDRCIGSYAGVACDCACHTEPPAEQPAPAAAVVRCFFGCKHAIGPVGPIDPKAAHEAMEEHYFTAHRADIARAVGWSKP